MEPNFQNFILFFPIFLFALTIHEVAHALTANWGGDLTATYQNRLSLNPVVHIDPIGTLLFPIISFFSGAILFGWARPVPVSEVKFKDKTWNVVVALAGPFSNLLLLIFGTLFLDLVFRCLSVAEWHGWLELSPRFVEIYGRFVLYYVSLNVVLMVFNLLPVPPLDGSHVLYHFVIRGRAHLYPFWDGYRRFGLILMYLFFLTGVGGNFLYLLMRPIFSLLQDILFIF